MTNHDLAEKNNGFITGTIICDIELEKNKDKITTNNVDALKTDL